MKTKQEEMIKKENDKMSIILHRNYDHFLYIEQFTNLLGIKKRRIQIHDQKLIQLYINIYNKKKC